MNSDGHGLRSGLIKGSGFCAATFCLVAYLSSIELPIVAAEKGGITTLGIAGERFTVNGKPTFLLGFSYYGALGAPEEFIRKDLDDFQQRHFNWLRIFATWNVFGTNISVVDRSGNARQAFMGRLKSLVEDCDRRGLIVD